jgi:hypothetical protein
MNSHSPSSYQDPCTPSSSSPYRPHTSSPLSESFSPPPSTSAARLQSRRLAQYKSITTPTRRVSSVYSSRPRNAIADDVNFGVRLFCPMSAPGDAEIPRSALLRDRLRLRCARRAQQAREKRVERERRRNGLSSDGEDMSMDSDDENDEDTVLNDEVRVITILCKAYYLNRLPFQLFRRIIASTSHKHQYSYRLSFQNEVGSSLDPDMEETAEWERILRGTGNRDCLGPPLQLTYIADDVPLMADELDLPPSDFDEEDLAELAAQAEEAELWAHLEADEHTSFSDIEGIAPNSQISADDDVIMT